MTLSWKHEKTDKNNTIKFTFINDHTNFTVFSIELNIYKDKDNFPNGEKQNVHNILNNSSSSYFVTSYFFVTFFTNTMQFLDGNKWFVAKSDLDLHLFPAFSKNGTHKCDEETKVKLNGVELIVKNVSLIAFNKKNDISSRKGELITITRYPVFRIMNKLSYIVRR